MPPKQDDSLFFTHASGHSTSGVVGVGDDENATPPNSPIRMKKNKFHDDNNKTTTLGAKDEENDLVELLSAQYQASALRASRLATLLLENNNNDEANNNQSATKHDSDASPPLVITTAACKSSLKHKLPAVLQQTAVLVESCRNANANNNNNQEAAATNNDDNSVAMVARTRSRLSLHRVDQYLNKIELTMQLSSSASSASSSDSEEDDKSIDSNNSSTTSSTAVALEEGLGEILASLRAQSSTTVQADCVFECHVSPLHGASELYFDVAVGPKVVWKQEGAAAASQLLPLQATVQPLIEVSAADVTQRAIAPNSIHPYTVTIESCQHNKHAERFHTQSGWTGQACIRLRLQAVKQSQDEEETKKSEATTVSEWSYADMMQAQDVMEISEARVSQPNAFPPRPRSSVDVYTSYTVGGDTSGLEVILVAKTYRTKDGDGETPQLEVELVMPVKKQKQNNKMLF